MRLDRGSRATGRGTMHLDDRGTPRPNRGMTSFVQASPTATRKSGEIKLHGPEAFAGMRRAGQLAAEALDCLVDILKPGVTTLAIDRFALHFPLSHKAYPPPLLSPRHHHSLC